jgi:predicted DNA-binding protein (UPF0278 family)
MGGDSPQVFARLDAWSVEQPPVTFMVAVTSSCCTELVSVDNILDKFDVVHSHAYTLKKCKHAVS